ncbi:MAG: transglutaminase-like cysteine peptidase [Gammaproteobacteria bacterium]|nr:transglutaminase-like cysteine peptidase [Gammaproteobacteria bacterium]
MRLNWPLMALLLFTLLGSAQGNEHWRDGLFGYREKIHNPDQALFPKWFTMLERHQEALNKPAKKCKKSFYRSCYDLELNTLIRRLQTASGVQKIKRIHRFTNKLTYISDDRNYRRSDYWATPAEFFLHNGGDCEDYGISKYYALRKLGFRTDQLRLVIAKDSNINIYHAVLAVYLNNTIYILDNRIKQVVHDTDIAHLEPIYAINENNWWRYLPPSSQHRTAAGSAP